LPAGHPRSRTTRARSRRRSRARPSRATAIAGLPRAARTAIPQRVPHPAVTRPLAGKLRSCWGVHRLLGRSCHWLELVIGPHARDRESPAALRAETSRQLLFSAVSTLISTRRFFA